MIFPSFWEKIPKKLENLVKFMLKNTNFQKKSFFFLKDKKLWGFVKIFPETQ
jgi:hypothetical protein